MNSITSTKISNISLSANIATAANIESYVNNEIANQSTIEFSGTYEDGTPFSFNVLAKTTT